MITRTEGVGLVLGSFLMMLGCSMAPTPATNPDAVRQHADKAFQELKAKEQSQQQDAPRSSPQPRLLGTLQPAPHRL